MVTKRAILMPDGLKSETVELVSRLCSEGWSGAIVDLDLVQERIDTIARAAADSGVESLYAVKSSTVPEVMRIAAAAGLGFDVANMCELEHALAAVGQGSVNFTSPAVPGGDFDAAIQAFRAGTINRWHSDSLGQLEALAQACPNSELGIRLNLDGLEYPEPIPLWRNSRFGIQLSQLAQAQEIVAQHGCRLTWLHTHNGSEENNLESYVFAAREILAVADGLGLDVEALDLGGGVLSSPDRASLIDFFSTVRAEVPDEITLTFEPGRFWLTDCVTLITRVLDVKPTAHGTWLMLDLGMMSHMQWCYSLRLPTLGMPGAVNAQDAPWIVCGRSCYEEDVLEEGEEVPVVKGGPIPVPGDAFVIGNVTGYAAELACDFNGIARPEILLWKS